MKRKIIYMLAFTCCLHFFAAAKQLESGFTKKCTVGKTPYTKKAAKAKKTTAANPRPFNFYLINI